MDKKFELTVDFNGEAISMSNTTEGLSIFEKLGIIKYMEMKYKLEAINDMRKPSEHKDK